MKHILYIYRDDWKRIFSVPALWMLIVALAILPSAYAWINIAAVWNPYGDTSGIAVAVVNEDKGAEVRGTPIHIGNEMIQKLQQNKKLGWVFVNQKEAKRGVKEGDYYAYLLVPSDFSKKLASILETNPKQPVIEFAVNEKINAVAPKIASSGASSITAQVSESFIEAVGTGIFSAFHKAGVELEREMPSLQNIKTRLFELEAALPQIAAMGEKAIALEQQLPNFRMRAQQVLELEQRIPDIQKAGDSVLRLESKLPQLAEAGARVSELQKRVTELQQGTQVVEQLSETLSTINIDIQQALNDIAAAPPPGVNTEELQRLQQALRNIQSRTDTAQASLQQGAERTQAVLDAAAAFSNTELPAVEQKLRQAASFVRTGLPQLEADIERAASLIRTKLPEVEAVIHQAADLSRNELPDFAVRVKSAADKVRALDKEVNMGELISFLKHDPQAESRFLASPISLETKRIFPIPNYGSAMAPFYTMLALWVGATLLVSSLRVDAEDAEHVYRTYELYTGRLLTFVTIGFFQALIVALGNLFLLHIYAANPISFVAASVGIGMVFMIITYTLCSVFGNVGKGMSIILLVLQVSSSGGTFPVALTSSFFQWINPFMPFTYAVSLLRETVGGLLPEVVRHDALYLSLFAAGSFLLAFLFKRPLSKRVQHTAELVRKTKMVP